MFVVIPRHCPLYALTLTIVIVITMAPGKLAGLVLFDADPLADITNTAKIRAAVANGRYFDHAALDGLLAEVRVQA
jgi:hypothetical protein